MGHLPWGFDRNVIKTFFNQFGDVLRVFVPKSKKTGRQKGYAFIEFEDIETARIVASTMHNKVVFDRLLDCQVIEDTNRYEEIFRLAEKKFFFKNKYDKFVEKRNKAKTDEEMKERVTLLLKKEEEKREKVRN